MRDSRKPHPRSADTVVVLDFETTGLSPEQGERAIEIGAVTLEGSHIADRFQSLHPIADVPFALMQKLARTPKASVDSLLLRYHQSSGHGP